MNLKKNIITLFLIVLFSACVGSSTSGIFGSGVSIALDPRTLGTQIDDSIMQKNLQARLVLKEKKYYNFFFYIHFFSFKQKSYTNFFVKFSFFEINSTTSL